MHHTDWETVIATIIEVLEVAGVDTTIISQLREMYHITNIQPSDSVLTVKPTPIEVAQQPI